ncbi:thioredoxin family protein [Flammeovirga pacifica]|uniref:Thioredoxin family protein n=1 Tax=Flammeovirga pacifica TaxID=915059 RepID=A0A1S1YST6_FLAPC|nr:thioredoxin family protein [Flammeovirga pacifica]OHX64094.1 thioredoxin family protein [Flammeovirga pacifica]
MKTFILSIITVFLCISCGTKTEKKQESNVASSSTTEVKSTGVNIGDVAPTFTLQGIDGENHSLNDLSGDKGAIVIFTCNHCPYAVAYEDRIIELDKTFKSQGYPVIAINPNDPAVQPEDSFELMKERAATKGFTFNYLFDNGQQVFPKYGATKTPHVFLLNKENNQLIVKYIGAIDDNYKDASAVKIKFVENAIQALQNNTEIAEKETKAIGCSIKVAKS